MADGITWRVHMDLGPFEMVTQEGRGTIWVIISKLTV